MLPAWETREKLLKMVANNQVCVISGETGCGKTTQVSVECESVVWDPHIRTLYGKELYGRHGVSCKFFEMTRRAI